MTKITLPTTDARIEQGVRAGLKAAQKLANAETEKQFGFMIGAEKDGDDHSASLFRRKRDTASYIFAAIRDLAADDEAVARIANGD